MTNAPILVVEDNAEDFSALSRAFRKHTINNPIIRCTSGEQALEYLQGYGTHPAWPAQLPALVLLDLNMPGLDGFDVLTARQPDARLRTVPIIVFTTSTNPQDVAECYRLGANNYLTKPMSYPSLEEKVGVLTHYWLETSVLPVTA